MDETVVLLGFWSYCGSYVYLIFPFTSSWLNP